MMKTEEIQSTLLEFISGELLNGEVEVGPDDNLLADGMVDSIGVGRLVAYIDERIGYSVPAEDLLIENFRTATALSAYLEGKLSEGS